MSTYNPRIKFTIGVTDYDLGQMSWFIPSYEGNALSRIIPRAKGVQIYSGEEMGGGLVRLKIYAFKILGTRLAIEQYLYNLITSIANKKGTLTIDATLTLTNCSIVSISPGESSNKWNSFTIEFLKSL